MKNSLIQTPNDNKVFEEAILEINEYIINRGNVPVNIFITKLRTGVVIRSISYEIKLTPNGFATLTNQAFMSIDELYYFLKSVFDQKKVAIQEVSNRMMKLILNIFNKKVELFLASKKEINGYIINDLFNKYLRLEENVSNLNQINKKIIEENSRIKEENLKFQQDFLNMKNDIQYLSAQNQKNENHINLILSGIDKINDFIDNASCLDNSTTNKDNQGKLNKSQSVAQNMSINKNSEIYQSYASEFNQSQQPTNEESNYRQNLDIYGEEQLFRNEEGRIIFRNGLLNGIIRRYAEIENIVTKIQLILKKGVKFNLIYKATELGDKASTFHQRCDNYNITLVLIETIKGIRFGGFTTQNWNGNCLQKVDKNAFVFSLDKNKTYDVVKGEPAVGCYPKFGPVFFGCQIRVYDKFFKANSTTCFKGLNYNTTEDFELNNGEKNFIVKEIEVYAIECIDI
jgi:hypothetical protein